MDWSNGSGLFFGRAKWEKSKNDKAFGKNLWYTKEKS
jgi:hypothetical protein